MNDKAESAMNETAEGMKGRASSDPVFGRVNRLMHIARSEDERGLVLSVGAFAETALSNLLLTYLQDCEEARQLIDGFNAPLGTLAARIKAAYALGLLTRQQCDDLNRIRKIRNEFAHNWEGCSLTDSRISSHITALNPSRIDADTASTPRDKLYATTSCILVELEYLRSDLSKRNRRVPIVATHLSLTPQ